MADDVPYEHHPKSNLHKHNGSQIAGTFYFLDLDTTYEDDEHVPGRIKYDAQAGAIAFMTPYGDSITQIGQESVIPCTNKTGSDITNGQLVYINGAQGSRPTITLADASDVATSRSTIGFATVDIANNATGLVAAFGLVRDIDTSAYAAGTELYLDTTAGAFTDTPPALPNVKLSVGIVVYQHATQGIVLCDVKHCNCFYTLGVGDIDSGNYTEFEADGTMVARGDATVWCDWKFSATTLRQGALSKPDYDYTNKGLLFPQNDETETVSFGEIIDHSWKLGSTFYPHLHYIQDEVAIPEFTLEYRVYDAGAAVPGWTTITTTGTPVFSYTSGSIHQVLEFPAIPMPAIGLAALFEGTLYRSTGDGVTGDVLVKEFDIHIEMDTIGSRQVFTK